MMYCVSSCQPHPTPNETFSLCQSLRRNHSASDSAQDERLLRVHEKLCVRSNNGVRLVTLVIPQFQVVGESSIRLSAAGCLISVNWYVSKCHRRSRRRSMLHDRIPINVSCPSLSSFISHLPADASFVARNVRFTARCFFAVCSICSDNH